MKTKFSGWCSVAALGLAALAACADVEASSRQQATFSAKADAGGEVEFLLSGGVPTRGQFDYPEGGQPPFPAVLLIQGSGATDRDETIIESDGTVHRPFVETSRVLNAQGVATFRYDKRGVCAPSQICDAEAYAAQTKTVLAEDARLAYERMLENPVLDPERLGILGHSEGTWLAPEVAQAQPQVRALALIGTGLGPMHVLQFSFVTLPLLGAARYDANRDGALDDAELSVTDAAGFERLVQSLRTVGQLFLLRYEGSLPDLRPAGINRRLDTNQDGVLDLITEVRPVYEAFLSNTADVVPVLERFVDPAAVVLALASLDEHIRFDAGLYASYLEEPADASLREIASLPARPELLIVNGEQDSATPASSAALLFERLRAVEYPVTLKLYPGLSHILSPQADIFSDFSAEMSAAPLEDLANWMAEELE